MRIALDTLTDELRRLKAAGVGSVSVSDEGMASLRAAVGRLAGAARAAEKSGPAGKKAPRGSDVPAPAPKAPSAKLPPAPTWTPPPGDKSARWNALRDFVANDPVCRSHVRPGKKVVLGVGSLDAGIFFVGEAPGAEEEIQGEPFVGPAGQLLTKMIGAMGLSRSEVYIGNIMNWRPELAAGPGGVQFGNRPPTEEEMAYCLPYLRAQIEIVNPGLIVALGASAAQGLLGFRTFKALGEVRGRWREFAGRPLMVTYHPSYILRNQSNRSKRLIWDDLLQVMERAGLPVSERQRGFFGN